MKLTGMNGEILYWNDNDGWDENCFKILKDIFLENPDQFPLIFITYNPKTKSIVLAPVIFENDHEKLTSYLAMASVLKQLKPKWYCIGTEMYFVKSEEINANTKPSQCENRHEGVLLLKVEKSGKKHNSFFERVNSNDFVKRNNHDFSGGVLSDLFNFTQQNFSKYEFF